MITIKQAILNQSSAVRTNVLPEVRKVMDIVVPDYDSVREYKTDIVQWLKPIVDLSGFHIYPTNGITEGLNWWMANDNRSIFMDDGDYQWVKPCGSRYDGHCIKYMSVPSAIDGNFKDIPINTPLALDLAYVGSTRVKKINISNNVDHAFYSLSKAFGIRNIRTGWYFTREPDLRLEALTHGAKYYNYFAHDAAETIIKSFDIDFVHKTMYHKQIQMCNDLDLVPSDSVWLATTKNKDYEKFMRDNVNARICLAGVMK